jgi:GMP synthase-like glutamine amidotransferase
MSRRSATAEAPPKRWIRSHGDLGSLATGVRVEKARDAFELMIIGGGPASARAIKSYREAGAEKRILLVAKDSALPTTDRLYRSATCAAKRSA